MMAVEEIVLALDRLPEAVVLIKVTLVLAAGLGAARLANRSSASLRHILLATSLIASMVVPAIALMGDSFSFAVPLSVVRPVTDATPEFPDSVEVARIISPSSLAAGDGTRDIQHWLRGTLLAIWAIGAALSLVPLVLSLRELRTLRRTAAPWTTQATMALTLARNRGISRPIDFRRHECLTTPLTFGLRRAVIFLPAAADFWSDTELRRALIHELEHVRRGDWVVHLMTRSICACFWFHPLVWIVRRRLALEAERACDDAVAAGDDAAEYAEQLVSFAERMTTARVSSALCMATRSDLSLRVIALLDSKQKRHPAGLFATLSAVATLSLAAAAIAATHAELAAAQEPGSRVNAGHTAPHSQIDDALISAAGKGDLSGVRDLLDRGANVNASIPGDGTALIAASRRGSLPVVELLLANGADINLSAIGDGNPLIAAASGGHEEIVTTLLDRGVRIDESIPGDENALIRASASGQLGTVKLLVSRGANVNSRSWEPYAGLTGEWRTPLGMARRRGHTNVADYLKSVGARE